MIAYLTHDEANSALARRIARRLKLNLQIIAIKDADQAAAADLLVLDLDHLPPECKTKLLRCASAGNSGIESDVAVHSYNLSRGESRVLRAAGVRVSRRLTAAILVPTTVADSIR